MNEIGLLLSASMERAPWGWGLFALVLLALIRGWPALSDAAMRARTAMSVDRRDRYERLEGRIQLLEARLEKTVAALHEAEMKLVSALAAYRLVIGELQKIDPDNPVLKQAQALLNVSYPSPSDSGDPVREMIRETHAIKPANDRGDNEH
jgi:hypothetical protein